MTQDLNKEKLKLANKLNKFDWFQSIGIGKDKDDSPCIVINALTTNKEDAEQVTKPLAASSNCKIVLRFVTQASKR